MTITKKIATQKIVHYMDYCTYICYHSGLYVIVIKQYCIVLYGFVCDCGFVEFRSP